MSLKDRLKAELGVLIVMAPEYRRLSRSYWSEYDSSRGRENGQALIQAIEFNIREQLTYEKISWINEILREEDHE